MINKIVFQSFSNQVSMSAGFGGASRAACNPRNLRTKLNGVFYGLACSLELHNAGCWESRKKRTRVGRETRQELPLELS